MLNYAWKSEVQKLLLSAVFFGLVGYFFNALLLVLCFGFALYSAWQLWQLKRVLNWLHSDTTQAPPESTGIWGEVLDQVYHFQRRQNEEKDTLQADVTYLRDCFSALSDAIVLIDSRDCISWCNNSATQLLGLSYPDDKSRNLTNLIRQPEFKTYFEAEDYSEPFSLLSPTANGRYHLQIQVTFFGKRDRILFARDVTKVKQLERIREDFIANVSHELRTPLTVINGYLEILADSEDYDEQTEIIFHNMLIQSHRMDTLVKDLILLSRLESFTLETLEPVSIAPILQQINTEMNLFYDERRKITIECPPDFVVLGNERELYSALSNLVTNAGKYSHDGDTIAISCYQDKGKKYISVKDTGEGISLEHIPRLTERFYRVDKSRSVEKGGTGLGLAIVKHILLRHKASLTINSTLGEGSEFVCCFSEE